MLSPAFIVLFWAIVAGLVLGVGVSVGVFVARASTRKAFAWLACVAIGQLAIVLQLELASRCAISLDDVARMLGIGAAFAVTAAALTLRALRHGRERPRLARLAPWLAALLVVLFVGYVGNYLRHSCGSWDVEELDYGQS